ncbi:hypothetical protein BT69DRAFT_908394 [Atractiella rhizophila]|nr:hypothetical protein BT69DRAFT_908394 [Atractiella rhizophila]
MSLSLKRPPPPPLRSPPKLFTIIEPYPSLLIVSVISFSLHFSLNSTLAGLYPNDEVLAEMEDRVKGEIWRFTVGAGRLICFVGMAVACVGVWGAVKHPPTLRLLPQAMALNAREAFVSSPSNSPSIQPAATGLNYFTSPPRTTANPLSGGSGESTPKEKGRNRSDSAATVVASSSAARNQGAGQELPRYDELQAGEKRVY